MGATVIRMRAIANFRSSLIADHIEVNFLGVSLDMEKNCTVNPFFEQTALSQQGVLPRYTVTGVDLV